MDESSNLEAGIGSAYLQALKSFKEGGVPVGSALMIGGSVVSIGHNRRAQQGSNILHGEMDCIERAGHTFDFANSVLFTTLSPCLMCSAAILLFRIPKVVILDNENTGDFATSEAHLAKEGVELVIIRHEPSIELNRRFQTSPESRGKWMGDVGK